MFFTVGVVGLSMVSTTAAFAATNPTTPSPRVAITAFRTCMAKHGVKLAQRRPGAGGPPTSGSGGGTDGGSGGGSGGRSTGGFGGGGRFDPTKVPANLPKGVTAKVYLAAVKACKNKIPKGGFGFGGANRGQYQAYISCLRDHGVTIPQRGSGGSGSGPTTTGGSGGAGGNGGGPLGGLDRNAPAFQAANQICAPLLPSQGVGAPPTTGAST